jgi:hypothetical protein
MRSVLTGLISFSLLIALGGPGLAQSMASDDTSKDKCSKLADQGGWKDQERFVWMKVCVEGKADFNSENSYGGNLDPKSGELPESRRISSGFLETILVNETYRAALTRYGVRIVGARFDDIVDLKNAALRHEILLDKCRFNGGIDFTGASSTYGIAISNSYVRWVKMRGIKIQAYVALTGDRIESGKISDDDTNVSIELGGAHIAGFLDLGSSTSTTDLIEAQSINVGQAIYLNEKSEFYGEIDFSFAKIGESLDLSSAKFDGDVDLSGTEIGANLSVVPSDVGPDDRRQWLAQWRDDKTLYLHNAKANTVSGPAKQGQSDPWPKNLDLNGFTYRSMEVEADPDTKSIDLSAIKSWLKKQKNYGAQPYEQLAQVFQNRGDGQAATEIRYAARDRERQERPHWWGERIWLTMSDLLIGYGYHPEQAIYGVLAMIVLGAVVLRASGEGKAHGMPYGIAYSFDMLLPIIKLREMHYKIDIGGWARYYFYVHRISGWVLASFLVAGISGLTK